jgi:hypothetical protein
MLAFASAQQRDQQLATLLESLCRVLCSHRSLLGSSTWRSRTEPGAATVNG